MLWGIVTSSNIDHAELLWEEFTQGIQTFFLHKASHEASLKVPKKKPTHLLILYRRFTKMIIYYLASKNNIHRRPEFDVHHAGDDFLLGNLKFVSKGETEEVFGMAIPKQLITKAIQHSLYYQKYLEMVAKNTNKTPQESERVVEEIRKLPDVERKGKAIVTEEQVAYSLIDLSKKKTIAPKVDKERGEEASTTMTLEERMAVSVEDQAGSDPGKGNESTEDQAGLDPGESHAALAGPDPEPMHDDFYATAYPDVHENPKLWTDEHVIMENPKSPSRTISSMKNLDDTDTFGDQFLNDKPTEDDQDKSNVEDEIVSIILDPSHQTDTRDPTLSTLVIDISSPQPSSHVNAPLLTATTETTTTILALPPPPPSQSAMDSGLAARVAKLEKRNAELERVFTIQNKMTNNLASRIFTLEHPPLLQSFQDLTESEMKQMLHKRMFESGSYKEHPEHAEFYDALEKSMSRNNMDALHEELSKKRKRHHDDQDLPSSPNDDHQDSPPPPRRDSNQSKKRRHDSDASGSTQPPSKDSDQSTKKKLDSDASTA
ncbi:hypothetical protein Tco_0984397 [Tanacetum coccineum]